MIHSASGLCRKYVILFNVVAHNAEPNHNQTIDSIVPVMIDSLKVNHKDSGLLQMASRDFLRIFTGAAHHIPRHRRVQ